jgi:hypothetical protein
MSDCPRIAGWLHCKGIARVINSDSSSVHVRVTVRAESPPWLPSAAMRWALNAYFRHISPNRAATHRMTSLTRSKRTAAGAVLWVAVFDRAQARTVWKVGAGL